MNINLNGTWAFLLDERDIGLTEKWFSLNWIKENINKTEKIEVPSFFTYLKGLERYTGVGWYFLKLPEEIPFLPKSHEYSIEFDGVNYFSEVWLNGYKIGSHHGGYCTFRFEFSPRFLSFTENNYLIVRVDCKLNSESIPSNKIRWINRGGIHRKVQILILEKTRIKKIKIHTEIDSKSNKKAKIHVKFVLLEPQEFLDRSYATQKPPKIDYELYYLGRFFNGEQQFNKVLIQTGMQDINPGSLESLKHVGHDKMSLKKFFFDMKNKRELIKEPVDLETYFANYEESEEDYISNGRKEKERPNELINNLTIEVNNPALWSPENPELYELKLELYGVDEDKRIRFGIRQIKSDKSLLFLNNKILKIKGIILTEEFFIHNAKYNSQSLYLKEQLRKDLLKIKSMGFNAIRAYQHIHNKRLLQFADEEGLLVVEEISLSGYYNFKKIKLMKTAVKYIDELLNRDYNHPSVIMWLLCSKIPVEDISCRNTINTLLNTVKKADSSRFVSYDSNRYLYDKIWKKTDISCKNLNLKWNFISIYQLNLFLDSIYYSNRNNPIIISQFGFPSKRGKNLQWLGNIFYGIKLFNSKSFISGWFILYRDYKIVPSKIKNSARFCQNGLFSEKNIPKISSQIISNEINKKFKENHVGKLIAPILSKIFKWLELYKNIYLKPLKNRQKRSNLKFYSQIREI